jgi:hypothetical protein
MAKFHKWIAGAQIALGVCGLLLVAVTYATYAPKLRTALHSLDGITERVETEADITVSTLEEGQKVVRALTDVAKPYKRSIQTAKAAASDAAGVLEKWDKELDGYSTVAKDAARICDTFQAQLPLKLPAFDVKTRSVEVNIPDIQPRTRTVNIPYPTAAVKTDTKKIAYPSGVAVEFGNTAGIRYPKDLSAKTTEIDLTYPSALVIGKDKMTVEIPDKPDVRVKRTAFDVPGKIDVTYRELMADEKAVLVAMRDRLASTSQTLTGSRQSVSGIRKLLTQDAAENLQLTHDKIVEVEQSAAVLSEERIPAAVRAVREQKSQVQSSRAAFSAVEGVIPLAGVVLALIPVGTILSGFGKLNAWGK